jgi:TRAP-type C4-dicarboxylate transport system substrate-binding protein
MNAVLKRLLKCVEAVALITLSTGVMNSKVMAADFTLRLHQVLPAQASLPKNILVPWMEKIEAESGGRIEILHFPSMQLGGRPSELMDQAIYGVADIVWTLPGYTPGRFPRSEVFELPFMMTDAEATSRAFWEFTETNLLGTEFKDLKVLGAWVHGPGLIHSDVPIVLPADLQGVKLRTPTRVTTGLFAAMGATTIGMPLPAMPEALATGAIDAAVIPWGITGTMKTNEMLDYHLEFGDASLYTATFILAMNKAKYETLPDDLKAIIDANSGMDLSGAAGRQFHLDDAPSRAQAEDLGNQITSLTPEQVSAWRTAAEPTIEAWITEADAKGLDGAALVEEARALIAKYTAN